MHAQNTQLANVFFVIIEKSFLNDRCRKYRDIHGIAHLRYLEWRYNIVYSISWFCTTLRPLTSASNSAWLYYCSVLAVICHRSGYWLLFNTLIRAIKTTAKDIGQHVRRNWNHAHSSRLSSLGVTELVVCISREWTSSLFVYLLKESCGACLSVLSALIRGYIEYIRLSSRVLWNTARYLPLPLSLSDVNKDLTFNAKDQDKD